MTIKIVQCNRCFHEWTTRQKRAPMGCPCCKSSYWNKPRTRKPRNVMHCSQRIKTRTRHYLKSSVWMALKNYGDKRSIIKNVSQIDVDNIIQHIGLPPDGYQLDHIRPLVTFNLKDIEQLKQAYSPTNLRWVSPDENMQKGNKWLGERWTRKKYQRNKELLDYCFKGETYPTDEALLEFVLSRTDD